MKKYRWLIVVVVVFAMIAAACGDSDGDGGDNGEDKAGVSVFGAFSGIEAQAVQQVIDDNSGLEFSAFAGRTMEEYDAPAREMAEDLGNNIIVLDEAETKRWKDAASPMVEKWIADMKGKGIDGAMLVKDAQALVEKHAQ